MLAILNLVAYLLNAGVTYGIGVLGAFDLPTNAELSLKYQTLVTPAGYAFSIWAVIFISQLISVIVQLVRQQKQQPLIVKGIGYNYLGACAAQIAWTITFSLEIIWASLICMIAILGFLVLIVYNQSMIVSEEESGKDDDKKTTKLSSSSILDFWLLKFPFSIHCGWISAATIVNLNVVLVKYGVNAGDQYGIALLCSAAIAGFAMIALTRPQTEFVIPSVLAWASFGIFWELQNPKDIIKDTFTQPMINGAKDRALRGTGIIIVGIAYYVYQRFLPEEEKKTKEKVEKPKKVVPKKTTTTNNKRRTKKEKKSE